MRRRTRQFRRLFFASLALFLVSMLSITGYTLWRLHAEAITNGLDISALHTRSAEDFLTQNLHIIELAAANALPPETGAPDLPRIERSFVTTLQHAPALRSMSLLDEQGRIIASSNPANVGLPVATQSYLPPTSGHEEFLRIGAPWAGRDFADGQPATAKTPATAEVNSFIPITRTQVLGTRVVTLLVALNPDYFLNHITQTLDATEGSVEVLRFDGTLLMDTDPDARTGSMHAYVAHDLGLPEVESGTFEQLHDGDHPVLTAFRASRLYPFVIITHLDRHQALQAWQTEAKTLLSVVLPTLLFISLLAGAFYRRQLLLAAQRAQADRLQRINATVFDASAQAILITDLNGNIISVNAAFTRITGYNAEEVTGQNPRLLASGKHDKYFYRLLWQELLQHDVWHGDMVNRRKDGSFYDFEVSITASRDGAGRLQHFVGVCTDITERKQLEAAREEALSLLQKIASRVPGLVFQYRLHPDGSACFPFASEVIRDIYRVSPQDVRENAAKVANVIHPDDFSAVKASILQSAQDMTPWRHEYRVKFADGTVCWLYGNAIPQQEEDGSVLWHGFIADITERKQSQAIFHALFDQASFLFGILDHQGCLVDVNNTALQVINATREEVLGQYFPDTPWWHDEQSRSQLIETLNQAYAGTHAGFETIHVSPQGASIHVMFSAMPIHMENGIRVAVVGVDISQRKRAEEALFDSEQRFRHFFEKNSSVMLTVDPASGAIIDANESAATYYGYPRTQLIDMPFSAINTLPPEQAALERQRALREERSYFLFQHRLASGEVRDVEVYSTPMKNKEHPQLFSIIHDITERRLAEEKLHLAATVFTHAREGILITAADGSIIDVNDAFTLITGYSRDEVLGRNPRLLSSGLQGHEFYAAMWAGLLANGHWYGEIWNRRKNGEVYAEMQTISTVRDAQGATLHYVALFSDITAIKAHEKQLEHIAHFDALTALPNRVLLADRLHQAMSQAQRHNQLLAVAFLDLDGFKAINDRHGHEAGDQLLIALAARMKLALREGDTLARLGGDEFVAVLLDLQDVTASVPMLERLLAATAQPVHVGEHVLQVSASLGVTFYPQADEVDADVLLRQADQAMYQAKLAGKNRYHVFDAEQDRSLRGHHESVQRIRQALIEREFVLHYQPKVNMRTGAVIGVEALIRWQHPQKGLLAPAAFLPVIEEHALAVELGEWVIDTALTQMQHWQGAGLGVPVSVNIGARQLQQADFVARLHAILARHPQVRAGDLELEVLETSALEDLAHVSHVILACRDLGVQFALDDFGTGYSSLTYLKRLQVQLLKIDQSFVRDMLDDPDDLAILEGVIGLAGAFRRQVIAEGVETVAHGTMLLQLGCELAQGYGIARPMPAQALAGWAQAWRPEADWVDAPVVSRADLPLLFASAEHRAWVLALEAALRGAREAAPLDLQHCRFGAWLAGEGLARYGAQPAFERIELLHRQVHALAGELLALQAAGNAPQALARLAELHGLRDALLVALKAMLRETWAT